MSVKGGEFFGAGKGGEMTGTGAGGKVTGVKATRDEVGVGSDQEHVSTKNYDIVTQGLLSNPKHQNHKTCCVTKNNIYKSITLSPKDY